MPVNRATLPDGTVHEWRPADDAVAIRIGELASRAETAEKLLDRAIAENRALRQKLERVLSRRDS